MQRLYIATSKDAWVDEWNTVAGLTLLFITASRVVGSLSAFG
jgi:hypothetical protein